MWNQPAVLLRAGDGKGGGDAVDALEGAGFRVLQDGPRAGTADVDGVVPELIVRDYEAAGGEWESAEFPGGRPMVPVLSLDMARVEPDDLVDLVLRAIGRRRSPRGWTA